jgi:hypothetical protein
MIIQSTLRYHVLQRRGRVFIQRWHLRCLARLKASIVYIIFRPELEYGVRIAEILISIWRNRDGDTSYSKRIVNDCGNNMDCIDPEDGGRNPLRNVGNYLSFVTALRFGRLTSSKISLWYLQFCSDWLIQSWASNIQVYLMRTTFCQLVWPSSRGEKLSLYSLIVL